MTEPTPEERRAMFRVVRGEPTGEELAALTVTLAALAEREPERASAPLSAWKVPRLRTSLLPGPGAWRASMWPR